MLYFTADEHHYHERIIWLCNRPYKDSNTMSSGIIKKHNAKVGEGDETIHVGDFTMLKNDNVGKVKRLLERYNGGHQLIFGNHDYIKPLYYVTEVGFTMAHTSLIIDYKDIKFFIGHDPAWYTAVENTGMYMICGHIHGLFKHLLPGKRIINVGVDVWDFNPVSIEEIYKLIKET